MLPAVLLAVLLPHVDANGATRPSNGNGQPRISFRLRDEHNVKFNDGGLNELYLTYDDTSIRRTSMNIVCDTIDLPDGDEVLSKMWEYWLEHPPHQRGFTSNTELADGITIRGAELSLAKFDTTTPTRYRCKINTRKMGSIDRQLFIYGQHGAIKEQTVGDFVNRQFTLNCGRSVPPHYSFDWYHNGVKMTDGEYDVSIERDDNNSEFARGTLRRERVHSGIYRCSVRNTNGTMVYNYMVRITGPPKIVHEHSSYNVAEGTNKVEMQCFAVDGSPIDQSMRWFYERVKDQWDTIADKLAPGKMELSENKQHIKNAKLIIYDVTETDRSKFKCSLVNNNGESHAEIMLRVKGRLAALWPALGIVIEIVLLIVIIIIFERRAARKHRRMEEQERSEREGLTTPSSKRIGNS